MTAPEPKASMDRVSRVPMPGAEKGVRMCAVDTISGAETVAKASDGPTDPIAARATPAPAATVNGRTAAQSAMIVMVNGAGVVRIGRVVMVSVAEVVRIGRVVMVSAGGIATASPDVRVIAAEANSRVAKVARVAEIAASAVTVIRGVLSSANVCRARRGLRRIARSVCAKVASPSFPRTSPAVSSPPNCAARSGLLPRNKWSECLATS